MGDFIPSTKVYGTKKFLKSCLNKTSKFHVRNLDKFFYRWTDAIKVMKDRQVKGDLVGRLIAKTNKYHHNKSITRILKNKFDNWKNYVKEYDQVVKFVIPKISTIIRNGTYRSSYPHFIKMLKWNRLHSWKKDKVEKIYEIGGKVLFFHLKTYFKNWKNQTHKLELQEVRNKTMSAHLKHFSKRMEKNKLFRSFQFWKGIMLGKSNNHLISLGVRSLIKFFVRQPFKKLIDRTKMLNLKIPNGISFNHAWARYNPNVVKSMAIRNCAIRPYLKKWKRVNESEKEKDLQLSIFKKLFYPHMRNHGKLILRKALSMWRGNVIEENKLNLEKKFHMKLMNKIYNKNHKLWLRTVLKKWRDDTETYNKNLEDISLGVTKLRRDLARKCLRDFSKKLEQLKHSQSKFEMVKKIMLNVLRNNDRGNVLYSFDKWKRLINHHMQTMLKQKILRNMINKYETRSDQDLGHSLQEKLLRWRLITMKKDYYEYINNIRVGLHKLHSGLIKKYDGGILEKLKEFARNEKIKSNLYNLISDYDTKGDLFILREKMKHWRIRVGDNEIMKGRMKEYFLNYLSTSTSAHEEIYKYPTEDLVECMKSWIKLKTEKALTIQEYCKNLLVIFKRMKIVQRNLNMHKIFSNLDMKTSIKVRLLFSRWQKNAHMINVNQSTLKIQKYLRSRKDLISRKNTKISKGIEKLETYTKKKVFNNIYFESQQFRKRQLLMRLMKDTPDELKSELMTRCLTRWWKVCVNTKEHAAAALISRVMKGYLTRKFKNLLLKRRARLNNVVGKLFDKHLDKQRIVFNRWKLCNQISRIQEAGSVIGGFLKNKLLNVKVTRAKLFMMDYFRKLFIKKLYLDLETASKINKDRGSIMFETIEKIFIRTPFNRLRDGFKWIGKLKKLHKVYPMVTNSLRLYYLPFYMNRWKSTTHDDKIRKLIQIQNWYRTRIKLWKLRTEEKKAYLCQKYLAKLSIDFDTRLKLSLKLWMKKAKYDFLNAKALAVQSLWRGNTSRKNVERVLNQSKLHNLFRKSLIKSICNEIVICADFTEPLRRNLSKMNSQLEKRYTVNNLIDLANNTIRNSLMYEITKKREFLGEKTLLREYFNRFKRYSDLAHESASKLQTKYRQYLAKKEMERLIRIKDILLLLKGKYETTQASNLSINLNRWSNRVAMIKLHDKAKRIQDYVRFRNSKLKNKQFVDYFTTRAFNLATYKLKNAATTQFFKHTLQQIFSGIVVNQLVLKTKQDKLQNIFVKRFNTLDEDLRSLYSKKYFEKWSHTTKMIENKELASALAIVSLWKGHLVRRFARKLIEKKARITSLLNNLTRDLDTRSQICFRLWLAKTRAGHLEDSAKTIQKFMEGVKIKNTRYKQEKRLNVVNKFIEDVDNVWFKSAPRNAINNIKSEASRKTLTKFVENSENKAKDHKSDSFKNIKQFIKMKMDYTDACITKIQKAFELFRHKKGVWATIEKIRKMKFLMKLMMDRELRIKNKAMRIWGRNALGDKWHSSASVIQNFLNDKVIRWKRDKMITSMENLYKLFRANLVKHNFIPFVKDLTNTIKINKLFGLVKSHIFHKFKSNIFDYEKTKILNKLFKIPPLLHHKMLGKQFVKFKTNTEKKARKMGAQTIQKNYRLYKTVQRENAIAFTLKKHLLALYKKHTDMKKYTFALWLVKHKTLQTKEHAGVICDFVSKNWEKLKNRKRWERLTNALYIKNNILSGLHFMKRYKNFKGLHKLFNFIKTKANTQTMVDLHTKGKLFQIGKVIKSMFTNFENRNETFKLWHFFRKWGHQSSKMEERDRALENVANVIETRQLIIGAQRVNSACLIKKFNVLYEKIKAKEAIKNIKWRANNISMVKSLGSNLVKAEADLQVKNLNLFTKKLYQIYIYKRIDSLFSTLESYRQNVVSKLMGLKLFNKLRKNIVEDTKHQYDHERSTFRSANHKVLSFKALSVNPKKQQITLMQNNPVKYLMPHLFNYLKQLKNKRLAHGFVKLRSLQRLDKFMEKCKNYFNSCVMPVKSLFMKKLIDRFEYVNSTPERIEQLTKLFRRSFIKQLTDELAPCAKIYGLMTVVKTTWLHKKLSDRRMIKELLRRWRYSSNMNKLAKAKMQAMYQNMHLNYLNMAKEIFGNDENNPGLIQELEDLSSRMGVFDANDEIPHKLNKKNIMDLHRSHDENYDDDTLNNYEPELLGDHPEYYYDEGIGDGTHGRYKVDTKK